MSIGDWRIFWLCWSSGWDKWADWWFVRGHAAIDVTLFSWTENYKRCVDFLLFLCIWIDVVVCMCVFVGKYISLSGFWMFPLFVFWFVVSFGLFLFCWNRCDTYVRWLFCFMWGGDCVFPSYLLGCCYDLCDCGGVVR